MTYHRSCFTTTRRREAERSRDAPNHFHLKPTCSVSRKNYACHHHPEQSEEKDRQGEQFTGLHLSLQFEPLLATEIDAVCNIVQVFGTQNRHDKLIGKLLIQ
jgi:hypothetical protein